MRLQLLHYFVLFVSCRQALVCAVDSDDTDQPTESGPVVLTSYGALRGRWLHTITASQPVQAFLGVPFAEPPVGDLRFALPRLWTASWFEERDASQYGNVCPQDTSVINTSYGPSKAATNSTSEDCLYLDIYTPSVSGSLPVMVFLHGGGYIFGTGSLYDGTALASYENIVVVAMNYRLGAFGYFHINPHGENSHMGHLGHLDQQTGLQWIKRHISRFGGDPSQVTLAGQSAGASSVSYHLLSAASRGLFQKAVIHSSYFLAHNIGVTRHASLLDDFATEAGCLTDEEGAKDEDDLLWCLHSLSTDQLSEAAMSLTARLHDAGLWRPLFDDVNIAANPTQQMQIGNFSQVPLLTGITSNEGYGLAHYVFPELTRNEDDPLLFRRHVIPAVKRYLHQLLGSDVTNFDSILEEVLDFYFGSSPRMLDDEIFLRRRLIEVLGDSWHLAPTVQFAKLFSSNSQQKVFFYDFAHRSSHEGSSRPSWHKGCDHYSDLQFFWGAPFVTSHMTGHATYRDAEESFSRVAMTYLANFVKNGDPNGGDLLPWKPFSHPSNDYMIVQPNLMPSSGVKRNQVDFWMSKIFHLKRKLPHRKFHEEL